MDHSVNSKADHLDRENQQQRHPRAEGIGREAGMAEATTGTSATGAMAAATWRMAVGACPTGWSG